MTLKKFLVVGGALAGAAVLANKDRRNRLMQSTKDFIDNARRRIAVAREPVDLGTGSNPVTTAPDYPTPNPT